MHQIYSGINSFFHDNHCRLITRYYQIGSNEHTNPATENSVFVTYCKLHIAEAKLGGQTAKTYYYATTNDISIQWE